MNQTVEYPEALCRYLENWLLHQKAMDPLTPGYSVCVMHKGEMLFNGAFGLVGPETKEPLTTDHLFRIASHSKTFTATAVLQLAERGTIDLDTPISTYLPFLCENPDDRIQKITVRHVLTHFSGISRDGKDPTFWGVEKAFPDKEEIIRSFQTESLVQEVGAGFKYSNYAYGLLTLLIEETSSLSFQDYMERHIFQPLGLDNIGTEYNAEAGHFVTGSNHVSLDGQLIALPSSIETGYFKGAIGFYSTAGTLCRFYDALLCSKTDILSAPFLDLIKKEKNDVFDMVSTFHYSYGVSFEAIGNQEFLGHAGGFPGQLSRTMVDQAQGITVTVLTNSYNAKPTYLQKGIWHILDFFAKQYSAPIDTYGLEETYYNLLGPVSFTPSGDVVYVTNPDLPEPFKNYAMLKREGDRLKILQDTGFGNPGEYVEIDPEGFIRVGGQKRYNRAAFSRYLDTLEQGSI